MTKPNNTQLTICPFLGLANDPTSHMAFISPENVCYRCKPASQIKEGHQNDYCLDPKYKSCPVHVSGAEKPMPAGLVYDGSMEPLLYEPADRRMLWAGFLLAGAFAAAAFFYFLGNNSQSGDPSAVQNPALVFTVSETMPPDSQLQATVPPTASAESGTPLPVFTFTISPFPTLTPILPAPTLTATQKPARSLEMPIGNGQMYLIHKVVNGENLPTLIETYKTSLEAILAVNSSLEIPIRINALIVIPLQNGDPQGLLALEPFQVTQDQVTPETLAESLKTEPELFMAVNGFKGGEILNKGEWVLVPR